MTGWKAYTREVFTASGAGNWTSQWLQCSPGQLFVMQVSWPAVAGLAGTLRLDMTQDPARAAGNIVALAPTTGIYGAWPTVAAGVAGTAMVFIKSPASFMRGAFAGGGGGAGNFSGWLELRGP